MTGRRSSYQVMTSSSDDVIDNFWLQPNYKITPYFWDFSSVFTFLSVVCCMYVTFLLPLERAPKVLAPSLFHLIIQCQLNVFKQKLLNATPTLTNQTVGAKCKKDAAWGRHLECKQIHQANPKRLIKFLYHCHPEPHILAHTDPPPHVSCFSIDS